jgi:hypothetical protein
MASGAASHPDVVGTQLMLLWSINERIKGNQGIDMPMPTNGYIDDIINIAGLRSKREKEEALARSRSQSQALPAVSDKPGVGPEVGVARIRPKRSLEDKIPPHLRPRT